MFELVIHWFHSQTGKAGVVILCFAIIAGVVALFRLQAKKLGVKKVAATYALGLLVLVLFHNFLGQNKASNNLTKVEVSKYETRIQRFPQAKDESLAEIKWLEDVFIPLFYWCFGAAIVLYIIRAHPGFFSPSYLKKNLKFNKWTRPDRSKSNELGSGDFASTQQIKAWTKHTDKYDTVLQVTDLRNSEGIVIKKGELVIPNAQRNRHILIIAKTGSGKTTKMILPILYNDCVCPHRSTIIIDSKQEMWSKLSGLSRHRNPDKNLFLFNPLDTLRGLSWNILSKVENDTDCKLIANSVIMATDEPQAKADSPFFRNSALQVLNGLMVGLKDDPSEQLSMPRIHQLINQGMHSLCDWLEAHPKAIRTTKAFVDLARSGSQNADTIMSELSMRLQAWDLTAIRSTTWIDEIDVEKIIKEPTLFVVELRESELKMLRPLANVIVVELLRYMTKYAEECPGQALPRPVSFVIDEFASALGRLPDIHIKLNTLRSRNVSIVAAIQSIGQIKGNYGEDWESVLSGFSTKIFMPSLDFTDSEWASKESGIMTVRYQTSSKGTNRKITENFSNNNASINEQIQQRAVLTPDEIGRPAQAQATFFMPETPVFQGHLVPYYKIPTMGKDLDSFSKQENEVKLRTSEMKYEEKEAPVVEKKQAEVAGQTTTNVTPITSTTNQSSSTDSQLWQALEDLKKQSLDWENTKGDARKWWEAFEEENKTRVALILKVAQEIASRNATITDFFLAYVYSNTDNIQATLAYLDYTLHMKQARA